MSLTQKSTAGRDKGMRIKSHAITIALEAIAQAQRQVDFERQRKDAIVKTAREELLCSEKRLTALIRHIDELRALAGALESGAAA